MEYETFLLIWKNNISISKVQILVFVLGKEFLFMLQQKKVSLLGIKTTILYCTLDKVRPPHTKYK